MGIKLSWMPHEVEPPFTFKDVLDILYARIKAGAPLAVKDDGTCHYDPAISEGCAFGCLFGPEVYDLLERNNSIEGVSISSVLDQGHPFLRERFTVGEDYVMDWNKLQAVHDTAYDSKSPDSGGFGRLSRVMARSRRVESLS